MNQNTKSLGARKPAWSARCDCRNDHASASGRCNVRNVTDQTHAEGEIALCESCLTHCQKLTTTMKIHPRVTDESLIALARDNQRHCENQGICLACGETQDSVEPDAEGYKCELCGEPRVYGPEAAVMKGLYNY